MGPITGAMTGGFGDLGQAAGAGLNEYTTQMDYDKLSQYVGDLFKQGVSPQQAVQLANQRFPGLMGGGQGQGAPQPSPQAPMPQVPTLNQGNVVMNAVPTQGANPLGSLGAPQGQPQPQSAPAPMGAQSARGPVDDSMLQTSPGRSPPQMQLTQQNPPQPEPYPNTPAPRVQQTSAAPSQAPQQGAQGMAGLITPRNMPLAQLLLQNQTSRANAQAMGNAKTQVAATGLERDKVKQEGRMEVEKFKAEARAGIVSAQLAARLQQFDVQNQTNIWKEYMDLQAKMAAIKQSGLNSERRDSMLKAIYQSTSSILAKNAAFKGMDAGLDAVLDEAESIRRGIEMSQGVVTTTGPDVVTPATPGVKLPIVGEVGGTPETKTPGKPKTKVGPGAAAPQPAGQSDRVSIIVVKTGKSGTIPRSQLDAAIKAGAVKLP